MLTAISLIFLECHTTNLLILEVYSFSPIKQIILFICFFFGFAVKIPIFPLYLWLPEAHVEAPTEGSVLLAGILLKLGGYGFFKFLINFLPVGCTYFLPLINVLALSSIILASFIAVIQVDFKKLIAYTSISHMNFVTCGMLSLNFYGIIGSILMMYGHGLISGGLFLCVGLIYDRYHTRLLEYYGGLIVGMPILGSLFFILTISNFGFPFTLNFVSEFLILISITYTN